MVVGKSGLNDYREGFDRAPQAAVEITYPCDRCAVGGHAWLVAARLLPVEHDYVRLKRKHLALQMMNREVSGATVVAPDGRTLLGEGSQKIARSVLTLVLRSPKCPLLRANYSGGRFDRVHFPSGPEQE